MAFTVPDFNISVDVFRGPWLTKVFAFTADANASFGRRVLLQWQDAADVELVVGQSVCQLLMPAGTDIRSRIAAPANDIIEIPSSSGRFYQVAAVDTTARGFLNEHVMAQCLQVSVNIDAVRYAGLVWPIPMV